MLVYSTDQAGPNSQFWFLVSKRGQKEGGKTAEKKGEKKVGQWEWRV
jgi:hypothetical protein